MDETDARRRNHWLSHIARHAHAKPGGIYLRFGGVSVTWAQIHERIGAVAAALRRRGVEAGERVAIAALLPGASLTADELRSWGSVRLAR
jgi:fatty-acyl-CoA synthase